MFRINEVLNFESHPYRVLAFYEKEVVWIPIYGDTAFPSLVARDELIQFIENEVLKREDDPFAYLAYETPQEGTTVRKKRDENYALIEPLVSDDNFFLPEIRASCVFRSNATGDSGGTRHPIPIERDT